MNRDIEIIFVDDEENVRKALCQTIEIEGYRVNDFASAEHALPHIDPSFPGVIITDYNMPGINGIEFLQRIKAIDADIPVVLLTGHADVSVAVEAMRCGAYDFLEKPFSPEALLESLARALEKRQLALDNRQLRLELTGQSIPGRRILGNHPSIRDLRTTLLRVKDAPADILVFGETGSGKEMVARFLHNHSNRHNKPFVAINCGAIPENMIESELFGHEAGAFTDAKKRKAGKFEYANGGTLFLDEIESMPMALQIKILRVLEERYVERLGSNDGFNIDVRIVAATKEDLKEKAARNEFRLDLYYRLNVIEISIPSLRERLSDIPLLFEHFLLMAVEKFGMEKPPVTARHLQALAQHKWPGNVRELRNVAECFVLLGEQKAFPDNALSVSSRELTLSEQLEKFEEQVVRNALEQHNGRLKEVQEALGIGRKTLYDKMIKFSLDKQEFKNAVN
ncbi:sigma-54-dependent transcriptional regulator [Zhongshania sp. BJYM1]|uniref:sigma-54-dependent transcriptional regulator n=1 Tax=Zhongshania aquatica TaxID=2965069 RepID=UPI0022B3E33E|nr:sigma-54 dependent transcriptional regulator [Marortus sp. BJYM1]